MTHTHSRTFSHWDNVADVVITIYFIDVDHFGWVAQTNVTFGVALLLIPLFQFNATYFNVISDVLYIAQYTEFGTWNFLYRIGIVKCIPNIYR